MEVGTRDLATRSINKGFARAPLNDTLGTGKADWPAYTTAKRTTMVFDDECRTVDDPDGEVRPIWSEVATS